MSAVDPDLVAAWFAARSIGRGLPLPVADRGALRVDSGEPDERCRYLFTEAGAALRELGEAIDEPFVAIKLCAPGAALIAALPPRWRLIRDVAMMICDAPMPPPRLPPGYAAELSTSGAVTRLRILEESGAPAARGSAVEAGGVIILDQVRVEDAHRRRGLGTALVRTLCGMRAAAGSRMILTASEEGRLLYRALGWQDYCGYSTATIPAAADH